MIGRTVSHYRILEQLGKGGMGVVYRAEDVRLGRPVAVKFLSEEYAQDPDALQRMEREARAASALNHPHICTIYDIGEYEGRPFIVMELVEGQTLRHTNQKEALKGEQIVALGLQIAEALEAAHAKGIIHRDLKPANVFITPRGQVKVLDFGLAKQVSENDLQAVTQSESPLTEAGAVVGTLHYMAPEILRGGSADPRSDLWSLGVLLYEMATRELPFRGHTVYELTSGILREPPRQIPTHVPSGLQSILVRCLAKEPEQRFQNASEVRVALETLAAAAAGSAAPTRPRRTRKAIDSLAVLPFENVSGDPEIEYFTEGITENIIYSVSRLPKVSLAAWSTVSRYKGQPADPQQVGRELNVGAVLTGRVAVRGEALVIGTELVDAQSGWQLWGQQYSRKVSDVLNIQEEIAEEISEKLRLQLTQADKKRLARRPTESSEAYQLYLKGRYYWNNRTAQGLLKGLECFELAVEKDRRFVRAYVGIADSYSMLGYFSIMAPEIAFSKARAAAMKAREADESLAEASAALALVAFLHDWDWRNAEESFRQAIQMDAKRAATHMWYAWFLAAMGRFGEAQREMEEAQRLDPQSELVLGYAGFVLYLVRRYDEAIAHFRQALEKAPDFNLAHWWQGLALMEKGEHAGAIASLLKSMEYSGAHPAPTAALAHLYGRLGWSRDEQKVHQQLVELSKKTFIPAHDLAVSVAGRADKDEAFAWLEKAWQERSSFLVYLNVLPILDNLRSDARFAGFVERMGFPASGEAR